MSTRFGTAITSLVLAATLAACGKSAGSSSQPSASGSSGFPLTTTPAPTTTLPPYHPTIDPATFTEKVTNPYFPLPPGTTYIFTGTRDGVPRQDEVTVTKETKVILGVRCVVVRDVVTSNTALVEKTTDWYSQDSSGNVWYFGEDTAEYQNGAVTSTAGTWLAGVDGALPGLIMEEAPKVGDAYRQEYRPGVAEDFAKVVQTGATAQTPSGNYDRVVITEDTDLLDATKLEHKSFAPGIGFIGSEGMVNGHHEITQLSKILKSS